MKLGLVALGLGVLVANMAWADGPDGCAFNGIDLYGDVEIVTSFPDVKVQIVTSFPDLNVQMVDSLPDSCGLWKIVTSLPDFKIQYVDRFPDIKIQFVDSFPGPP